MANKIQLRRDTASNWTRINPILADGEPGLDITNNKLKMGDGTTAWANLPYLVASSETTRLVNGSASATLGSDGVLSVPGEISSTDGITMTTGRGSVQFGANLEAPGVPSHFHINKSSSMDLFFGDDSNFIKLPSVSGVEIQASEDGVGASNWAFDPLGTLTLPTNGVITTTSGIDGSTLNISNITIDNGGDYNVTVMTSVDHGLPDGAKVGFSDITSTTQLNGNYYYAWVIASNQFMLYNDPQLTNWLDGSTLTPYVTYDNRPMTQAPGNGVTINYADSPWGAGYNSLRFNGGGWLDAPASPDFGIGISDFAVTMWVAQYEYTNAPRLFDFGFWPNEAFGLSSEEVGLTFWYNELNINTGTPVGLNNWHYILVTRYQGNLYIKIDDTVVHTSNGFSASLTPASFKKLTIGAQGDNGGTYISGLNGTIRDFKIDVGQGIDPAVGVPTGPATVNGYTKVLILGNDNVQDSSGHASVIGGGFVVPKLQGSEIAISTDNASNGSDAGDVVLRSNYTMLKVNGKKDYVAVADMAGEYPINSTGQATVSLALSTENNTTTIDASRINIVYINLADGYSGTGAQTVELGYPVRPGMEVTVINDAGRNVDVVGWDGPPYGMVPYETIKMTSYTHPVYGNYWWVSSSFSW